MASKAEFDDFGFTAVTDEDRRAREAELQAALDSGVSKAQTIFNMIRPLLVNLQKDPEAEWLHWPNRAEKSADMLARLEKVLKS